MFETLGQYKILDRIGAGGMGEVYRARDTRLGRTVAIKVLAPELKDDPERRERFLREARAAAALSHPNIAALYEIGEDQGQLFLAFEFVPGETLQTVIGGRPLNPRRAIDFAAQIADALADAHAEGIVHRDIKPANIIVTPKDKVKVLDFGLAAWTGGGAERAQATNEPTVLATSAGTTLGTIAYMSPEQTLGERVDDRTDIFSLGIVLFEMLTGRLPFSGATPAALSLQIVQATAPAVSDLNPSVPKELDSIVARTLTKPLVHRCQSAAMLSAELRAVGDLVDARSDQAASPMAKSAWTPGKRTRGTWMFAAVILLVAAGVWLARGQLARMWRQAIGSTPAPMIAVIPFETDAGRTFFADGLADDLITRLGQTPGLKVLGRSATRQYRGRAPHDVAAELGARVILTGSVRQSGDTVKVSMELVDPNDGRAIWSQQYTREAQDIFAVQAQVAEDVATALRIRLQVTASSARAAARTVDPRAYELYVKGRQAIADRKADAIALYEQAIAIDPGLAEAFAGIVEAIEYNAITFGKPLDPPSRGRMKTAAERAYQLDPDLPQSNVAMAIAAVPLRDALTYLRRAVERDPTYGEAFHQIGDQILDFDPARAVEFYRASLVVDPALIAGHSDIASALITLERSEDAHREIDAMPRDPRPGWRAIYHAMVDIDQRRADAAVKVVEQSGLARPGRPAVLPLFLATAGRFKDALDEMSAGGSALTCEGRALKVALLHDMRDERSAQRLAAPILADAAAPDADGETLRCGAAAAAGLGNAAKVGELLERIAGREDSLRAWARRLLLERGAIRLRGRLYPWDRVVRSPSLGAAREQLDAAYAREREIARSVLAGLP